MTIYKKIEKNDTYYINGYFLDDKLVSSICIKEEKGRQVVRCNGIEVKRTKSDKAAVDSFWATVATIETAFIHLGHSVKPM